MIAISATTWILIVIFFLLIVQHIKVKLAFDGHASKLVIFGVPALLALAGGLVLCLDPSLRGQWDIVLLIVEAASVLFLNSTLDASP